ncbi:MAG: sugar phosphate nucleotidyltransferase [Tenuifilum sp.]|uniref:nucleotidyltransferase family protein n=1 Tax=Tenuifilum sp. TaxID=2760880 RepID=UPI001B4DA074|nr:nucleotidyltransferase [Bacteroidales bacterium]HOK61534.1 sugar phosphate nucleotidyltransferase [Tenuifilum sp.]MBP9028176.1 nucleotidyltransferase [Bacteroidales bacterium]HOK86004.1 sugar phosphate nucleotidyltransferase [Tenuifilum sp.]HON70983.1 sugar phosphate nucleotidyltransferase [Tenuifilum sp.]
MKPTLVILAAGMGSRYGGLKQVDALGPNGETIIDYSVYDAIRAGFGKVVFVIRKSIEKDFLEVFGNRFDSDVRVEIAFQELDMLPQGFKVPDGREKPWGTAHAVWVTRHLINEPFAVINADDFYGFDTFRVLAQELSKPNLEKGSYFMVGYKLGNTLSEQGAVSRGVCSTDKNGYLLDVVERTHIERVEGEVKYKDENGNFVKVDEGVPVSMNFWGFTTDFFGYTEKLMTDFFSNQIGNVKAEFYIPTVVNRAIKEGIARCKVLETKAEWFGVTYPGDRPMVVNRLKELTEKGVYPSPLWSR